MDTSIQNRLIFCLGILASSLLFSSLVFAEDAKEHWKVDEEDRLLVKFGVANPTLDFSLTGPGADATFVPNNPSTTYYALSYRNLGISYNSQANSPSKEIGVYGQSDYRDLQLRFFGHKHSFEFVWQRVTGFSLQGWPSDDFSGFRLRPDLRVTNLVLNYLYTLKPEQFSPAITFDQIGVPTKTGGSVLLFASAVDSRIRGRTSLIPGFALEDSGKIASLREFHNTTLLGGVGYGHLIKLGRFYVAFSYLVGVGLGYQSSIVQEIKNYNWAYSHRQSIRLSAGYNHGNHLFIVQGLVDSTTSPVNDGQIQTANILTMGHYGYRFNNVPIPIIDRWLDKNKLDKTRPGSWKSESYPQPQPLEL